MSEIHVTYPIKSEYMPAKMSMMVLGGWVDGWVLVQVLLLPPPLLLLVLLLVLLVGVPVMVMVKVKVTVKVMVKVKVKVRVRVRVGFSKIGFRYLFHASSILTFFLFVSSQTVRVCFWANPLWVNPHL